MPALIADIAAASRDSVSATWSQPDLASRYPNARDGSVTPATGYFDEIADAQAVIDARGALIGGERRRFSVETFGIVWPDLAAGVPVARLVDAEQATDSAYLAARIEIDLEAETTTFELYG